MKFDTFTPRNGYGHVAYNRTLRNTQVFFYVHGNKFSNRRIVLIGESRGIKMSLERDGDGFLLSMSDWSVDVMHEMAREDDKELSEEQVSHIMLAREMYEETSMVPRVKDFGKALGMDRKAKGLYDAWKTGPMKQIAKYGGLPKPTGCV